MLTTFFSRDVSFEFSATYKPYTYVHYFSDNVDKMIFWSISMCILFTGEVVNRLSRGYQYRSGLLLASY